MTRRTIESHGKSGLGARIRAYRQAAHLTQRQAAEAVGITREYLASIETGRAGVIYPDIFLRLHDVLGFPGWEILEAMGYPTDMPDAETEIDPRLIAALGDTGQETQRLILQLLDAIVNGPGGAKARPRPLRPRPAHFKRTGTS